MAMPRAETGSGARRRRSSASITVRAASTSRRCGRTAAVNPGAVSVALRSTLCSPRATLARLRRRVILRARSAVRLAGLGTDACGELAVQPRRLPPDDRE